MCAICLYSRKSFMQFHFSSDNSFKMNALAFSSLCNLIFFPYFSLLTFSFRKDKERKLLLTSQKCKLLQKVEEKTRLAEVKASWQERKSTGELPSCHPPSKPDNPRQNHNLDISVHASHGLCGVVDSLVLTRLVVVWCQGGFRGWHVRFKQ